MDSGIERLFLRHFRGATTCTEVSFATPASPPAKLVVIFGENGSGKSTLADAIDLVCNRTVGSLVERSSADVRRHLAAIGYNLADVRVDLTAAGRTWTAGHNGKGIVVEPDEPTPTAHVLRRSQLLRLIEAAPGKRYEELRRFIDVEQVEQSEAALRGAERAAAGRLAEEARLKQAADTALQELWEDEGQPGGATALSWARSRVRLDLSAQQQRLEELQRLLSGLEQARAGGDAYSEARARVDGAVAELRAIKEQIEQAEASSGAATGKLIEVLQQVQEYLAAAPAEAECPVCRRPAAATELQRAVAERLAPLTQWREWSRRLAAARQARDNAVAIAQLRRAAFLAAARTLADAARAAPPEILGEPLPEWDDYDALLDAGQEAKPEAVRQAKALLAILEEGAEWMARQREALQRETSQFNAIRGHYQRVIEGEGSVQEMRHLHERLRHALEIVHDQRINFTQRILDEIAGACNRLYSRIHPEEPLGVARFFLDEKRKASLHQQASFQGHADVPPQAYFSDSHLDTLGFCLFLALVRRYSGGRAIVVLDDIFTAVDDLHLQRILDLLLEESRGFQQIVITTHVPQWRERAAALQAAGEPVRLVDLGPWSNATGIVAREMA